MNILHKFSNTFNELATRVISSHFFSLLHISFITAWLLLQLDLTVLALLLTVEGVTIWSVVLKATNKIRQLQEKKEQFENKRFRQFLESDVEVTQQSLKMNREIFKKIQDLEDKIEELYNQISTHEESLEVKLRRQSEENPILK